MGTTLIVIGSVITIFFIYVFYMIRKMKKTPLVENHERIVVLSDQNFENKIKTGLSLVDFWAVWCMPCKVMAPILNRVAEDIGDKASVCKIDIQQYPSVAAKYNVRSIPTLILFNNGKEIKRFMGVKDKEFLINQINHTI